MDKTLKTVFYCLLFLSMLTSMELGDVWWHLKTGEWILQNRTIPSEDPFSISGQGVKDQPALNSFWIFQAVSYGVYKYSGFRGLIAFKSLLYLLTVFCIDNLLKRLGLGSFFRYLILSMLVAVSAYYDETRPQTFSFLFFAATLSVLELYVRRRSDKIIWALPPLMLIWANSHGGYVSGVGAVVTYAAVSSGISIIKDKTFKGIDLKLIMVAILTITASLINPNALRAVSTTLGMFSGSLKGDAPIHEHLAARQFAALTGQGSLYVLLILQTALCALSFIPFTKKPDPFRAALFLPLSVAAFVTFRAGIFFSIAVPVIIGGNLADYLARRPLKSQKIDKLLKTGLSIALLVAIVFISYPRSILRQDVIDDRLIPVKVSEFIYSSGVPGNVFHPYEWGGYFIWSLNPKYKSFVDSRGLGLISEYNGVVEGKTGWQGILSKRNVNVVAFWPVLPYQGRVPRIIFGLLKDDGWVPVYWDLGSMVFVREQYATNPIKKTAVWELLTSLLSNRITFGRADANAFAGLGELYAERGMMEKAWKSYKTALDLDPSNKEAQLWTEALK